MTCRDGWRGDGDPVAGRSRCSCRWAAEPAAGDPRRRHSRWARSALKRCAPAQAWCGTLERAVGSSGGRARQRRGLFRVLPAQRPRRSARHPGGDRRRAGVSRHGIARQLPGALQALAGYARRAVDGQSRYRAIGRGELPRVAARAGPDAGQRRRVRALAGRACAAVQHHAGERRSGGRARCARRSRASTSTATRMGPSSRRSLPCATRKSFARVVLDGAYPLGGGEYAWYPAYAPAMRDKFNFACQRSPACSQYPGDSMSHIEPALRQLRAHPFAAQGAGRFRQTAAIHRERHSIGARHVCRRAGPRLDTRGGRGGARLCGRRPAAPAQTHGRITDRCRFPRRSSNRRRPTAPGSRPR